MRNSPFGAIEQTVKVMPSLRNKEPENVKTSSARLHLLHMQRFHSYLYILSLPYSFTQFFSTMQYNYSCIVYT